MKVNSINNSLNFGRVFAVTGSKENMQKLGQELELEHKNMIVMPATDLYVGKNTKRLCARAAKQGDEICFIITGKEDMDKVKYMQYGWGSTHGVSKHITDFIKLDDIKKAASKIISTIKE